MKIYSFDEFERNVVVDESISANYDTLKVNEGLFGIGSPSKPAIAITADYIREHTPEEIGQVFFDNAAYYMDKAKYEVDKAIDAMNEKMKDIWAEVKNSAEVAKKFADGIVYSVKAAISEKYNAVKKYAAALPNAILCGVCYLVKLGVSGIDAAKNALTTLGKDIADFMSKLYTEISDKLKAAGEKVGQVVDQMKEKISLFAKVSAAVVVITAKKIEGLGQDLAKWVAGIFDQAKEKAVLAVMTVKNWVSSKTAEIANYVKEKASEVANTIEESWDALKDDVKKVWGKITDKISEWTNNVKVVAANIAKKAGEIAQAAGEKLISIKDAGAATVIKKGVKALNKKNYSLEDVIDMVTNAYNESLYVMKDGSVMLNENEFYGALNIIAE